MLLYQTCPNKHPKQQTSTLGSPPLDPYAIKTSFTLIPKKVQRSFLGHRGETWFSISFRNELPNWLLLQGIECYLSQCHNVTSNKCLFKMQQRIYYSIIPFFELLRTLTPKLLGLQCSVFLPRGTPKIYLEIGYLLIGKNLPEVGPIWCKTEKTRKITIFLTSTGCIS